MTAQTAPRHDFYSDTKTRPSEAMLRAVLGKSYGDEQKNEDPVTAELCRRGGALPRARPPSRLTLRWHVRGGRSAAA